MKPTQSKITYQNYPIDFHIIYSKRKTLQLCVESDSTVRVRSPLRTSILEINTWVLKNAAWIVKKQEKFNADPVRQYINGEKHLYLGMPCYLRLSYGDHDSIKLEKCCFFITSNDPKNPEKTKALLYQWYSEQAHTLFLERFSVCWQPFEKMNFKKPRIRIRKMKSRWGSLSSKGNMSLNLELIRAPIECIDHVITHELCHIKHLNHGKGFYQLFEKVMPDWKVRKKRLSALII